jgi:hypothetical protein
LSKYQEFLSFKITKSVLLYSEDIFQIILPAIIICLKGDSGATQITGIIKPQISKKRATDI